MRPGRRVVSISILLMSGFALAVSTMSTPEEPAARHVIVRPEQLVWKLILPGTEMAVVSGDPDKKGGIYVIRIRTMGKVKVTPHWHPTEEQVTVLEGSFWMAHGDTYDAAKLSELKAGGHSIVPAGMRHFGLHEAGNVIEVFGEAPFVINWVNPADISSPQ